MLLLYEVVPFLFSLCCKTDELNKQIGFFFSGKLKKVVNVLLITLKTIISKFPMEYK